MPAAFLEGPVVVDGMCGCGGDVVAMARCGFQKVIGIDLDKSRLLATEHNAHIYGVADRVTTIAGDFTQLAPGLQVSHATAKVICAEHALSLW